MHDAVSETGIAALTRFARLASEAKTGEQILPLLAASLVEQVGCDAVAILENTEAGARFVRTEHTPKEVDAVEPDPDLGTELGAVLLRAIKRYQYAKVFPLVSGGGLFGQVALLAREDMTARLPLADALVDLAAASLGMHTRMQQLMRSQAELRASHDTLVRTEKLRALGQMAAGISHDLKNMLNPLSLHLQVAAKAIDRKELDEAKRSIAEMKQIIARGVQQLERLRDYSRQQPEPRAEEVDLDDLAREAVALAKPLMSSRGGRLNRIREELAHPPKVMGRSAEIVSAIVNLVVNAIDAMPDGGSIRVRTGSDERHAWIEVEDEGPGIPPEVRERIFEPFFTTKGKEGSGLGLAMVHACMQRHCGSVQLDTAPGKGSTFRLLFPIPQ